uniref:Spexin hormone n=1 Tax=Vombatus ursinus TaxID=29139 RepID=A0A4X2LC08_VOMUR
GIQSLKASGLALLLAVSFISLSCCAPQRLFERRNWTPQAILYLKGTQGRQFISEENQRKDLYNRLQLAKEINLDQSRFLEDNLLNWRK